MLLLTFTVCEDCEEDRQRLIHLLREYENFRGICLKVQEVKSGEELIGQWNNPQVLLLDLDLPGKDGVIAVEELQARGKMQGCHVIITSGMPERFRETYHIMARDFVVKPIGMQELSAALDYALSCLDPGKELKINIKRSECMIYDKDIHYAKALGNYCLLETPRGTGDIKLTITELEKVLPDERFFRCHRSYLVNLECIKKLDQKGILLKNGERLPVSRNRFKNMENAFSDYLFGQKKGRVQG